PSSSPSSSSRSYVAVARSPRWLSLPAATSPSSSSRLPGFSRSRNRTAAVRRACSSSSRRRRPSVSMSAAPIAAQRTRSFPGEVALRRLVVVEAVLGLDEGRQRRGQIVGLRALGPRRLRLRFCLLVRVRACLHARLDLFERDRFELARVLPVRPAFRGGCRAGHRFVMRLLDHPERGAQQRLDAARLREQTLAFVLRRACDRARLLVCFGNDDLRLALRVLDRLGRRLLGGEQCGRKQRLALAHLVEALLGVLELVRELSPLAPDLFEAIGNVLEHVLDLGPFVAEQPTRRMDVSQLNRCVTHPLSFLSGTCRGSRWRS